LYDELLAPPVRTPVILPGNESVFNQYVIRAPRRDELQQHLSRQGVGSAIYYPVPLHLQECFASLGGRPGDFPVAEQACQEVLALPVYPELADEQIRYVAETINTFYRESPDS
jgi:dTDP-4-amino-4,6-dideoxygalactose transaminase